MPNHSFPKKQNGTRKFGSVQLGKIIVVKRKNDRVAIWALLPADAEGEVVKRVLLTGMSGTGKSSVIAQLVLRGYRAIDTDYGWAETGPEGDWMWPEDRIQALLSAEDGDFLFLSGCVSNQGKFYPQFDAIILLSAPTDVLIERLRTRTDNSYGKEAGELAQILANVQMIEPLLRRTATHEIDTQAPLDQVVATILQQSGACA